MSRLRRILVDTIRTFIQNQLETGTRREIKYDPHSLIVVAVVDTGRAFDLDQKQYPMSVLLSCASDYQQGLVVTLRDELLAMLFAVVGGKRVDPQRFAKEVLDAVENIPVEKFLRSGRPANLQKRERRLRARFKKLGFKLQKSRVQNPLADQYGSYEVIDARIGAVDLQIPTSLEGLEQWKP